MLKEAEENVTRFLSSFEGLDVPGGAWKMGAEILLRLEVKFMSSK